MNGTKDISRDLCPFNVCRGKGFGFISDSTLVEWQKKEKKRRMKKSSTYQFHKSVCSGFIETSASRNTSSSLNFRRFFFVS